MSDPSIYRQLGVSPVLNAAGTFTDFGGSLMHPETSDAWRAAAREFVDMKQWQDCLGRKVADLLDVEAAMITGGAANSILLGTAAAICSRIGCEASRLPLDPSQGYHVLRQRSHRDPYDQQVRCCGVKIVDVDPGASLANLINERTVMLMAYNVYEPESTVPRQIWLETARQHQIPTMLDAAADVPPASQLAAYVNGGYDLVAYSGGKAIRGPQDTGLLLGRSELIAHAKRCASPNEGVIGRVTKVTKEDMVAFWFALKRFFRQDAQQIVPQCEARLKVIEKILADLPSVETERVIPPVANPFPHLIVHWNDDQLPTRDDVRHALRTGEPGIVTSRVYGTGDKGLLISVINLRDDDAQSWSGGTCLPLQRPRPRLGCNVLRAWQLSRVVLPVSGMGMRRLRRVQR